MKRDNLQYHILNILSVLLFSYITAVTINQFVIYGFTERDNGSGRPGFHRDRGQRAFRNSSFEYYTPILESGFFLVGDAINSGEEGYSPAAESSDLVLIGTITGPGSIARAVIQERTEKRPGIYKLWNDVHGYQLIRIRQTKVHLKSEENIIILDLYDKKKSISTRKDVPAEQTETTEISENQAIPVQEAPATSIQDAKGFTVTNLPDTNPLYQKGLRQGDIIKAINDVPVKDTNDYIKKASSVVNEETIILTVERNGAIMKINISDGG